MSHRPLRIAPSVLSADFSRLGAEITSVADAGADWIHLDVMDGQFVPNLTFGAPVIRSVRGATKLPFDAHLMVEEPSHLIDDFIEAGADHISVHVEACKHLHRVLEQIRAGGAKAGVVLNPGTAPESISAALDAADIVLVMTVNPGFGGQSFIPAALRTIRWVRSEVLRRGLDIDVAVDGGIKANTIGEARAAGANVFVAGSAVFKRESYAEAIRELRASAEAAEKTH